MAQITSETPETVHMGQEAPIITQEEGKEPIDVDLDKPYNPNKKVIYYNPYFVDLRVQKPVPLQSATGANKAADDDK